MNVQTAPVVPVFCVIHKEDCAAARSLSPYWRIWSHALLPPGARIASFFATITRWPPRCPCCANTAWPHRAGCGRRCAARMPSRRRGHFPPGIPGANTSVAAPANSCCAASVATRAHGNGITSGDACTSAAERSVLARRLPRPGGLWNPPC
jgi:hypothetical protein